MVNKKTMLDYVLESPQTVIKNIEQSESLTESLVNLFLEKNYSSIWIVASGSSSNSSYCARMFMRKYLNVEVKIIPPYTFCNYEDNIKEDDFVFVISQSGYSTNAIDALKHLKSLGRNSIGITGNINSDFRLYADCLIDYGAGVETVGYVTKGVTSLVSFLMLFALHAANKQNKISSEEVENKKQEMIKAMDAHKEVTKETLPFYKNNIKALTSMSNCYVCGCGANFGTALEGALKIGETVQIPSVAYEIEEYIHGPNLQLNPNHTVFFIDNGDHTSGRTVDIFHATQSVTDRAFIITNDPSIDDKYAIRLPITTEEEISPLYMLPFFQIIAYHITEDLGKWNKHPLFNNFKQKVGSKSQNYAER